MNSNRSPSTEMFHSVGALMDTSFLRAAVADANDTRLFLPTPAGFAAGWWSWVRRHLSASAKPA